MSIDHGKLLVSCRRKLEAYRDAYGLEYVGGQELSSLLADIDRALAQPAEAVESPWIADLRNEAVRGSMKDVYWLSRDQVFELIGDATGHKAPAHPDVIVARATDAAQGAVAVIEKAGDRYGSYLTHCDVTLRLYDGFVPAIGSQFYPRPQAAPAQGDGEMAKIGRLIETQDNRITEAPIFIVQQKRWICGVDPDYGGERVWINHARESVEITEEAEIARLDAEYAEEYTAPEGYTLTGKMHVWDFVTACFTEQGCKDYLARDGHNLCEPRIYAAGSYRNEEWRSVRKFLMSLAAAPSQEGES